MGKRRNPAPELVLPPPGNSFATERVVGAVLDCIYHSHPEYEITYVDSGFGTRLIGDSLSPFDEGDLVLIGGGIPHLYHNRREDSLSRTWARSMVVKFREDCLGPAFFETPEMAQIKSLLLRAGGGLSFPPETADNAGGLMRSLFKEGSAPRRVLLFLELLTLLAEAKGAKPLSVGRSQDFPLADASRIERVLRWLHKSFAKDIALEDAAKVACLAPGSFSRFFRKATRKSFIAYIEELRVANACRLLSTTDKSIGEIGIGSGFRNLSNFNRQFLRLRRMTPKAYRAKVSAVCRAASQTF